MFPWWQVLLGLASTPSVQPLSHSYLTMSPGPYSLEATTSAVLVKLPSASSAGAGHSESIKIGCYKTFICVWNHYAEFDWLYDYITHQGQLVYTPRIAAVSISEYHNILAYECYWWSFPNYKLINIPELKIVWAFAQHEVKSRKEGIMCIVISTYNKCKKKLRPRTDRGQADSFTSS